MKLLQCFVLASIVISGILSTPSYANSEEIRFISSTKSGVINLSSAMLEKQHKQRRIVFEKIDNSTGAIEVMLMMTQQLHRAVDPRIITPLSREETRELASHHESVFREGNTLSIRAGKDKILKFRDWEIKGGDGDGASYKYAGMIPKTNLHLVDGTFQHDAPGTYIVNSDSGRVWETWSAADLVALSEDAQRLFVMSDGLNPPFGFFVSFLAGADQGIEMECFTPRDQGIKIVPLYNGWLELVLLVRLSDQKTYEAIPVSISQKQGVWHIEVPDPQRFAQVTKLSCWQ